MKTYDFIVIGSGIAGLTFAREAAEHGSVAVITKRALADANTSYAQGGIACVSDADDSIDLHVQDTLTAGAGLCDEEVVRMIVSEGPARIRELIDLGVHFDLRQSETDENGEPALDLTREGGHSRRRILHSRDATGREIERALIQSVKDNPRIDLLTDHMAVDLITTGKLGYTTEDRCVGVYVLDETTGDVETLRTDRLILATGGCGKVYLYTTNPAVATGDGLAMAWRAGATISNMEFIQFHPTCLFHPEARSFLITEAVRGEGGKLVDANGHEFMEKYHSLGALAPRDIVARAIDAEMKRTGQPCVYLDISEKPADFVKAHFPTIYETLLPLGIDMTRQPIPVVPAAHYQCGGIQTDTHGATTLPGLFAIGEAACTGLHGANRLASNSLLEAVVMSYRAAKNIAKFDSPISHPLTAIALPEWKSGNAQDVDELVVIYHNWDEIRRLMWDYVGIVRTDKRLQRASARLRNLHHEIQEFYWDFKITTDLLELRNLVTVASLIVDSALARKESRGLHYTLDYLETDDTHYKKPTLIHRI